MSWQDNLSGELADDWTRLQQRLSDLLEDLKSLAQGQVTVSGVTSDRVFWWYDLEMKNLDSFKRLAYMDLNLWDGIKMGWDVEAVRSKINIARTEAQRGLMTTAGLDISPEVEPPADKPPEINWAAIIIGGVVIMSVFGIGIAAVR